MITELNRPLIEALDQYRVRFCCEDCVHFEFDTSGCSLGYVTQPHRLRPLAPGQTIVFCKTFELG